jgi:hypothetical protein
MSAFNGIDTSSSDEEGSSGRAVAHLTQTRLHHLAEWRHGTLRMMLSRGIHSPPSTLPTSESIKNAFE